MRLRISVVVFSIALGWQQAGAVVAPLIARGDHLFVSAQILGCGRDMHLVDHAEVGKDGKATFLGDIELVAEGKPVYKVVDELADAVAANTGHRPQTIEIALVSPDDHERILDYLLKFMAHAQSGYRCRGPENPDQNPLWRFDNQIASLTPSR